MSAALAAVTALNDLAAIAAAYNQMAAIASAAGRDLTPEERERARQGVLLSELEVEQAILRAKAREGGAG